MPFREVILALALGPFIFYLMVLWAGMFCFRKERRNACCSSRYAPPVSILKPVRGLDREAYENFVSFCHQDYPEYEVLFCVSSLNDPSVPVIERVKNEFPGLRIRLLIRAPAAGTSDKLNNLCRLVKEARYDLLVISDSDIRVGPHYLRDVAAPFVDPGVGAVTVLFRSQIGGGFGSALDGAGSAVEFASHALLAQRLEGIRFTLGFTMATTKSRLAEIGGFEAFASHYVDDYELGRRIAQRGYRIELVSANVSMVYARETVWEFLRHELRWTIGLRSVRPGGHAAMGFTFGLAWTLLAVVAAPSTMVRAVYILAYLLLRFGVYVAVGIWGLRDEAVKRFWWLAPVRDLAAVGVWLASFFTNRISWRGSQFRVQKGILVPCRAERVGMPEEIASRVGAAVREQ